MKGTLCIYPHVLCNDTIVHKNVLMKIFELQITKNMHLVNKQNKTKKLWLKDINKTTANATKHTTQHQQIIEIIKNVKNRHIYFV